MKAGAIAAKIVQDQKSPDLSAFPMANMIQKVKFGTKLASIKLRVEMMLRS